MKMRLHQFCLLLLVVVVSTEITATTQNKCIDGCKCKDTVSLSRKSLDVFNCDRSFNLSNVAMSAVSNAYKGITIIRFKNVDIEYISKDAFEGFNDLEEIKIEDSSIGKIDGAAFDLPQVSTINFSRVQFGEKPTLSVNYLEELIFSDCQLSEVPNLDYLPALTFLNLENNLIKDINELAFSKVERLDEITLSNNSISKLPPNLFINNKDLSTLKLDYNPLETFTLNLDEGLEFLSLVHCNLSVFDRSSTRNLTSLSYLDLSGNQIKILPIDTFELMKSLNTLDLSDNKLVELDDNIFFENSNLDKINLNNNKIQKLPNFQTKENVFDTKFFSCSNCGLKSINGLENMKGLVSIDLSHNEIKDIEGVFTEMRFLSKLFLANNQISAIGINSFALNSKLDTLDLSHNPLLPLDPVVFSVLPELKKLNISNTGLDRMWTNYNAELPALSQLYVGNNKMSVINVKDIKTMPKLDVIDLKGNPLLCTEELHNVVKYFIKNEVYPADTGYLLFKTHEELNLIDTSNNVPKITWSKVLPATCDFTQDFNENTDNSEDEEEDDDFDDDDVDDEDENGDDYDLEYETDENEEIPVEKSMSEPDATFNLARITYILSITSVFILTAVLVSVLAVVVTLLILKRNKSFNMHTTNLPRFRIPLWSTMPGQKKHSGSVYRPLSEELYGSRTPIINRYDFNQTPQVHNSIP